MLKIEINNNSEISNTLSKLGKYTCTISNNNVIIATTNKHSLNSGDVITAIRYTDIGNILFSLNIEVQKIDEFSFYFKMFSPTYELGVVDWEYVRYRSEDLNAIKFRLYNFHGFTKSVGEVTLFKNNETEGKNVESIIPTDGNNKIVLNELIITGVTEEKLTSYKIFRKDDRFVDKNTIQPNVEFFKRSSHINVSLPLHNTFAANINQEELVEEDFFKKERAKIINPIVDNEKVVFTPYAITTPYDSNVLYNISNNNISPVYSLEFNLHFRDRFKNNNELPKKLDNDWETYDGSFWNGYDKVNNKLEPVLGADGTRYIFGEDQSDLIGYLGFDSNDVYYQKAKLAKSFLRLSFYDSKDINKQKLLYTSTIFVNSGNLFGKYAKFKAFAFNDPYYTTYFNIPQNKLGTGEIIGAFNEWVRTNSLDEAKRLSTRFTITDKYDETSASEGFYLYLFKESMTTLQPQTIYMKVEYNHAGYGKIIPFMMPTINNIPIGITDNRFPMDGFIKANDRSGLYVDMQAYYSALFIELKLAYDKDSGKYMYYLPRQIINNNNKLVFNLYESKTQ